MLYFSTAPLFTGCSIMPVPLFLSALLCLTRQYTCHYLVSKHLHRQYRFHLCAKENTNERHCTHFSEVLVRVYCATRRPSGHTTICSLIIKMKSTEVQNPLAQTAYLAYYNNNNSNNSSGPEGICSTTQRSGNVQTKLSKV